jgi:acetyl-CoA carboxylase carboxyl transferase subunit alpha
MASTSYRLQFEQPIYKLEEQIAQLEAVATKSAEERDQIRALKRELADTTRRVYSQLDPWDTVQVARHPERPMLTDYLNLLFDEFVELHGDKFYGDDRALRTGFAKLDRYKVLVVGHYKGKTLKERNECFFGCAHPEGYRKAMSKMRLAAKYKLPIICMIDTPGAYPGIGAEERGQAQVIAESMLEMSRLPTPIICVVIGEGGSGGALAISVADQVLMLQYSVYSVISPEGCASILWKTSDRAEEAAEALGITAHRLKALGLVDKIVSEPVGGAHRDHKQAAANLKRGLNDAMRQLSDLKLKELLQQRYDRLQSYGRFNDTKEH